MKTTGRAYPEEVHEAGHVVAALIYNIEFKNANMKRVRVFKTKHSQNCFGNIIMRYAGCIAESKYSGFPECLLISKEDNEGTFPYVDFVNNTLDKTTPHPCGRRVLLECYT